MIPLQPIYPLFPYTTLFRSVRPSGSPDTVGSFLSQSHPNQHRQPTASPRLPLRPSLCLLPNGSTRSKTSWQKERSEEHTSELQSRGHLVCRLLLEKKKQFMQSRFATTNCFTFPSKRFTSSD